MRTRLAVVALAGAAVLATGLGAAPSSATTATTWTIRPGGDITAKSGTATVTDNGLNAFTCSSLTARGTLKAGSGLSGSQAGSVSAVNFTTCTSPLHRFGAPWVSTIWYPRAAGLPWHLNFSSDDSGVVRGTISHIQIQVSANGACSAVIDGTSGTSADGTVRFRYVNGTGRLRVLPTGGNLHAYNVRGCLGIFSNADPVTISTTFALFPKQAITSP